MNLQIRHTWGSFGFPFKISLISYIFHSPLQLNGNDSNSVLKVFHHLKKNQRNKTKIELCGRKAVCPGYSVTISLKHKTPLVNAFYVPQQRRIF